MKSESILFFYEDTLFRVEDEGKIKKWIEIPIKEFNKNINQINFIICSDEYLKRINIEYLDHDYYTDIITFNNSDSSDIIETDIFISIDRVKENSISQKVEFLNELHRVVIHGILHLLEYNDKTEKEKIRMRKAEDHYLNKLL